MKALAICTTNPYIQVYKVGVHHARLWPILTPPLQPLLLLALDEYFSAPHPSVLARLFDALNAIPMRGCPVLSRDEKLILRASERTDLFEDRFLRISDPNVSADVDDLGEMLDGASIERHSTETGEGGTAATSSLGHGLPRSASHAGAPADWMHQSDDGAQGVKNKTSIAGRLRKSSRVSLRDSDSSRSSPTSQVIYPNAPQQGSASAHYPLGLGRPRLPTKTSGSIQQTKRDTHYFDTSAKFRGMNIPMRIPLSIFEEEVGEVCRTGLAQCLFALNYRPHAVLRHQPRPDVHTSKFRSIRTAFPSPFAHGRCCDASHHSATQCPADAKANHLPRSWSSRRARCKPGLGCLCSARTSAPGLHRTCFPVLQPRWLGYTGGSTRLRRGRHQSPFRGPA